MVSKRIVAMLFLVLSVSIFIAGAFMPQKAYAGGGAGSGGSGSGGGSGNYGWTTYGAGWAIYDIGSGGPSDGFNSGGWYGSGGPHQTCGDSDASQVYVYILGTGSNPKTDPKHATGNYMGYDYKASLGAWKGGGLVDNKRATRVGEGTASSNFSKLKAPGNPYNISGINKYNYGSNVSWFCWDYKWGAMTGTSSVTPTAYINTSVTWTHDVYNDGTVGSQAATPNTIAGDVCWDTNISGGRNAPIPAADHTGNGTNCPNGGQVKPDVGYGPRRFDPGKKNGKVITYKFTIPNDPSLVGKYYCQYVFWNHTSSADNGPGQSKRDCVQIVAKPTNKPPVGSVSVTQVCATPTKATIVVNSFKDPDVASTSAQFVITDKATNVTVFSKTLSAAPPAYSRAVTVPLTGLKVQLLVNDPGPLGDGKYHAVVLDSATGATTLNVNQIPPCATPPPTCLLHPIPLVVEPGEPFSYSADVTFPTSDPAPGLGYSVSITDSLNGHTYSALGTGSKRAFLGLIPSTSNAGLGIGSYTIGTPVLKNQLGNVVPTPATPCILDVSDAPYLKAYGGDITAGAGFQTGGVCPGTSAEMGGYTQKDFDPSNAAKSYAAGTGTQLMASSTGFINGLVSGSLVASGPPEGLSVANTFTPASSELHPPYGGGSGLTGSCLPDYYGTPATAGYDTSEPSIESVAAINPSTKSYYYTTGPTQTISAAGISVPNGARNTIYINGDLNINGNITYAGAGGWATPGDIPALTFVVSGNINIDSNVTELDGTYIAQGVGAGNGVINDCTSLGTPMAPASMYITCNNQLLVVGSFMAKHVDLLRTYGSLEDAPATTEPYGTTASCQNAGNVSPTSGQHTCAGEVFQYSPEMFLTTGSGGGGSSPWQAITSLPPVL